MNFEWSAPKAQFEIFGVPCEVEIGDTDASDRLQAAAKRMQAFDYAKARESGKPMLAMSAELRAVIRSVIGTEAAKAVFEGRKPNVVMEASMLAYVFERINEAVDESGQSIDASVKRIAALSKPIGDEG
ncbi:hypothetical protein M1L65_07165 [Slackia exigua]|uniref:hypothetical protein n=1 Tax=Slackia exigua TaxID=84109 RepID=UPI003BA37C1B